MGWIARVHFESFEIPWVKQGQFQIFQKSQGWFIPKIAWNKHVIIGQSHQTNNRYLLRAGNCKSASGKLENSRQLQNSTVNDAVSISTNRMIKSIILYSSKTLYSFNNSMLIQWLHIYSIILFSFSNH